MKIKDILAQNKMALSPELAGIMAKAMEKVFPTYYEGCKYQQWTDYKICNYASDLELNEADVQKVIELTARYAKIWSFS